MKYKMSIAILMLFVFFLATMAIIGNFGRVSAVTPPIVYYTLTIHTLPCDGWSTDYGSTDPSGVTTYLSGTNVRVYASASLGWHINAWILDSIDITPTGYYQGSVTVTMNSDHILYAIFNPNSFIPPPTSPTTYYNLNITTSACDQTPSGYGTTSPIGVNSYLEGTAVNVTAYPSAGWFLQNWVYDGNLEANATTFEVTMNSGHSLEAIFNPIPIPPPETGNVTLTVSKFGSKPVAEGVNFGTISPDVGTYTVPVGTNLTFTATDTNPDFTFYSWRFGPANAPTSEYHESLNRTITVTVTTNSYLWANFVLVVYTPPSPTPPSTPPVTLATPTPPPTQLPIHHIYYHFNWLRWKYFWLRNN